MTSPAGVHFREMTVADIPAGLGLCRASRWNQTEHDWRFFLETAPHGALVAVDDATVVGTVATVPYGPFAWISMVLVDPAARHRGIGTELLDRGLALVPESVAARLDATPAGEGLYRKRGFVAEYGLARGVLDVARRDVAGPADPRASVDTVLPRVRPLASADWPALHEMDTRAFGASRAPLLERLAGEAPEYAWAAEREGRLDGYLLGRHGHVREHLGPLIAGNIETAARLLDACRAAHPDRTFFLDVPDDQQTWRAHLSGLGFAIERPFLRMRRGRLTSPEQLSRIYAITGPEFG